jgi:hypothetical protein
LTKNLPTALRRACEVGAPRAHTVLFARNYLT